VKLLLDACVWGGTRSVLQEAGHDVVWVGDWASDPGDEEILAIAHQEDRVLVALDKDFGELALVQRMPHCGIVRLVSFCSRQQTWPVCGSSACMDRSCSRGLWSPRSRSA
jgi:predicted nuclease of predicted toxin-antitoxin system